MAVHSLDGIHYHKVRSHLLGLFKDLRHISLTVDEAVGGVSAKSVGPHLYLLYGFLTGDIKGFEIRSFKGQLQGKGTFSYSGLTAHQHQASLHYPAAKKAVYFRASKGNTILPGSRHIP